MKINKKIAIPLLTFAVVGVTAFSANQAFADTDLSTFPPMVQRLAEKFNLNADEVKTFLDEDRQTQQKEMLSEYETMLSEAVTNGELNEEQKALLLAKKVEQQAQMAARQPGQGNGPENREEMQAKRDEISQWAKDNGIDEKYLFMHGSNEGKGGGREGFGRSNRSNN
jgi:hypothetical protein